MKGSKDTGSRGPSRRMSVLSKVFMVIGVLTVVYLFITEVLMRILALLTV